MYSHQSVWPMRCCSNKNPQIQRFKSAKMDFLLLIHVHHKISGALFSLLPLQPRILHHPPSGKLPVIGTEGEKIVANHTLALKVATQTLIHGSSAKACLTVMSNCKWASLWGSEQKYFWVNRNILWMSQITIILQGTKYLIHSPSHRQYILTPPWRRKPKKCHLVRTRSTKSRIYGWHCSIVSTAGRSVLHIWV